MPPGGLRVGRASGLPFGASCGKPVILRGEALDAGRTHTASKSAAAPIVLKATGTNGAPSGEAAFVDFIDPGVRSQGVPQGVDLGGAEPAMQVAGPALGVFKAA